MWFNWTPAPLLKAKTKDKPRPVEDESELSAVPAQRLVALSMTVPIVLEKDVAVWLQ